MKKITLPRQTTPHLCLEAIHITEKQGNERDDLTTFFTLFEQGKMRKALREIKALLEKEPENPYLLDYLAATFIRCRRVSKSHQTIKKNYEKNSNILFVKVRYADFLIQKGKLDEVASLFNQTFDLQKLFPKQKNFLINDYVFFMSMAAWYFFEKGEEDKALIYIYMVKKVTKSGTSIEYLMKKMRPKKKWFSRFRKKR